MYVQKQRESGPYAIETFQELRHNTYVMPSRFEVVECATAYADQGLPSHCVRLFVTEAA